MEKICFVIMGYGKKTDIRTGKTYDLDKTYLNIIKPAVEKAGLTCVRGDEIQESGIIDKSMYALLLKADVVIADITTYNPNAIYELGVRHAVKPYTTIILKEKKHEIPFDLSHVKVFSYEHMGNDI
jgi:nucleoside 2-deoxyribosyltransferase